MTIEKRIMYAARMGYPHIVVQQFNALQLGVIETCVSHGKDGVPNMVFRNMDIFEIVNAIVRGLQDRDPNIPPDQIMNNASALVFKCPSVANFLFHNPDQLMRILGPTDVSGFWDVVVQSPNHFLRLMRTFKFLNHILDMNTERVNEMLDKYMQAVRYYGISDGDNYSDIDDEGRTEIKSENVMKMIRNHHIRPDIVKQLTRTLMLLPRYKDAVFFVLYAILNNVAQESKQDLQWFVQLREADPRNPLAHHAKMWAQAKPQLQDYDPKAVLMQQLAANQRPGVRSSARIRSRSAAGLQHATGSTRVRRLA